MPRKCKVTTCCTCKTPGKAVCERCAAIRRDITAVLKQDRAESPISLDEDAAVREEIHRGRVGIVRERFRL